MGRDEDGPGPARVSTGTSPQVCSPVLNRRWESVDVSAVIGSREPRTRRPDPTRRSRRHLLCSLSDRREDDHTQTEGIQARGGSDHLPMISLPERVRRRRRRRPGSTPCPAGWLGCLRYRHAPGLRRSNRLQRILRILSEPVDRAPRRHDREASTAHVSGRSKITGTAQRAVDTMSGAARRRP